MKLFEIRMLDYGGHSDSYLTIGDSEERVREAAETKGELDECFYVSISEVKIDGYTIDINIDQNGVVELDTEGWNIKVGQVYSSPYQPAHLKIDKILMSESCDSDEAMLYGTWISPQDYSKKIMNIESEETKTTFRVWHLNQEYSLEEDVEKEEIDHI